MLREANAAQWLLMLKFECLAYVGCSVWLKVAAGLLRLIGGDGGWRALSS